MEMVLWKGVKSITMKKRRKILEGDFRRSLQDFLKNNGFWVHRITDLQPGAKDFDILVGCRQTFIAMELKVAREKSWTTKTITNYQRQGLKNFNERTGCQAIILVLDMTDKTEIMKWFTITMLFDTEYEHHNDYLKLDQLPMQTKSAIWDINGYPKLISSLLNPKEPQD